MSETMSFDFLFLLLFHSLVSSLAAILVPEKKKQQIRHNKIRVQTERRGSDGSLAFEGGRNGQFREIGERKKPVTS